MTARGSRRRGVVALLVTTMAVAGVAAPLLPSQAAGVGDDDIARQRQRMVDEIAAMARATRYETGRERFSERVMAAMGKVPRHRFVPESEVPYAYRNHPLPIGSGQTISQPYIVALSTDLIDPRPGDVVLEIGTGSGYQAAVLAELVGRVYTIEIVDALGRQAEKRLRQLGYANVEVRIGDGYLGWPEAAPFDGIVVTAAAPVIPAPLIEQLKPGGRMVIPVGPDRGAQDLLLVEKRPDGTVSETSVLPVRFVPFTGEGVRKHR